MRGFFCRLLVEKSLKYKGLDSFFFCYDFLVEHEGGDPSFKNPPVFVFESLLTVFSVPPQTHQDREKGCFI